MVLKRLTERVTLSQGTLSTDTVTADLYKANGFQLTRHFWRMVAEFDGPPAGFVEMRPLFFDEKPQLVLEAQLNRSPQQFRKLHIFGRHRGDATFK